MTPSQRSLPGFFLFTALLAALPLFLPGCSVPVATPFIPREEGPAASLLTTARQALRNGEIGQAEMYVERALRVEPGNPRSWHTMGQVRYAQKNYGQAVQFCLKSNSLAGGDPGMTRENWLLMEQAYTEMGRAEKARDARSRAR